jgi:crotonobetainyl-CoA:carnitine CoA-transferase CaiB-like acyl-CoA transferase
VDIYNSFGNGHLYVKAALTLLEGVRVVEVGSAIAAPLASMILSELGAEIVKVENVERGDDARFMGKRVKGESLYFFTYNKNKRSIAVNLKHVKGREILVKLVEKSDVLVENFRPGVMGRLGLSYEELSKVNKGLVYCSVSGFGQYGPYSQLGGYDLVVQAMSGLMYVTGKPEDEPMRAGVPIVDILAAYNAAAAIIAALYARSRTGEGTYIDASLFETGIAAMGQWISTYVGSGEEPVRFGNKYPPIAPYEVFRVKDGYVVIAVGNESQWQKLCKALNREDLLADPRFTDNQKRIVPQIRAALAEELEKTLSQKTSREWLEVFWGEGIPSGPVNSVKDLVFDEHVRARDVLLRVQHPVLGEMLCARTVPLFDNIKPVVRRPPPLHGEHTREVLRELGYSDEEIGELEKEGVVKSHGQTDG